MFRRFPNVTAHDSRDCGAAAVASVAAYYGKHLSIEDIRDAVGTGLQGASLGALRDYSRSIGFEATAGRIKEATLNELPLPAIVHLDQGKLGHFAVLYRVGRKRIVLGDPSRGTVSLDREAFLSIWTRNAVLFKPGSDFHPNVATKVSFGGIVQAAVEAKWLLVSAIATGILLLCLSYVTGIYLEKTVDNFIPAGNLRMIGLFAGIGIAVDGLRALGTYMRSVMLATGARQISNFLAGRFIAHLFSKPLRYLEQRVPGDHYSKINDIGTIRLALTGPPVLLIGDVVVLVVSTIAMIRINAAVAGFVAISTPIVCFIALFLSRPLSVLDRDLKEKNTRFIGDFIEAIAQIRVFKAYRSEHLVIARLLERFESAQSAIALLGKRTENLISGVTFITSSLSIVVIAVGAGFVVQGRMSLGELLLSFSMASILFSALDRLPPSVAILQDTWIANGRLEGFINTSLPASEQQTQGGQKRSLTMKQVSFRFGLVKDTISNMSLECGPCEWIAVVGKTGSGKSTLAALVAGLYLPSSGSLEWVNERGEVLSGQSSPEDVCLVFPDSGIIAGTIRENLELGVRYSDHELIAAARDAEIYDYIESLPQGFDQQLGSAGSTLSSGERQRLAMARAFLRSPQWLLLDEATSNLDPDTEKKILQRLRRTRRERSTMLITHRIHLALDADRIVVVAAGKIVEQGAPAQLLQKKGDFYQMYSSISEERDAIGGSNECCPGDTRDASRTPQPQ